MSRVSCIITEDVGGIKHEYTPVGLKFKSEGTKKSDTLEAKFTIDNKVRENYTIAYIQDVVDVSYLDAIWNFQLSALDERGYDLDGEFGGSTNISEDRFVQVTDGRFKGNYALDFTTADQAIKVPNAKAITRINLDKQFDIYIFFTPVDSSEEKPFLWSFSDGVGGQGLEIGIQEISPSTWVTFVRLHGDDIPGGGGNNPTILGTTIKSFDGDPNLIRVFRDGDNIVHVELNGFSEGSISYTTSLQPTGSPDILFGCDTSGGNDYIGQIHQIRSYHGTSLTQSQADAIRQARPALYTMKLAGRIWNVDDKQTYKIAQASSFSKDIVKRKLSPELFSGNDNVFDLTTESFKDILQTMVDATESGFTVKAKDPFIPVNLAPSVLFGNFIAVGDFVDVTSILLLFSETVFYTTPRKLLIIETREGHDTDFIFDQDSITSPYDITESVDDDSIRIGDIFLTGNGIQVDKSVSINGTNITLRKFIAQLDNQLDLANLASSISTAFRDLKTRYIVKINSSIHWVRFNHKILLNNTKKNITNDSFIVAQIEYNYPSSITKIMMNEIVIDFFNITNNDISVQESLVDNTIV